MAVPSLSPDTTLTGHSGLDSDGHRMFLTAARRTLLIHTAIAASMTRSDNCSYSWPPVDGLPALLALDTDTLTGIYCLAEVVLINPVGTKPLDTQLIAALATGDESTRLKAALAIGSDPEPGLVDILVARCAIEPDFYVRDMLTWSLTRLPSQIIVPRLLVELRSQRAQARSQALHTLSKIRDAGTWPAITRSLLRDPDDEVARSAWRAAVALVPHGQQQGLAEELAGQLGRGGRHVQLSLSRALVALGEEVIGPILRKAMTSDDPAVRAHASATDRLLRDPEAASKTAVDEAKRIFALGKERNP